EHVEQARLLRSQHQTHRGGLRDGDESRTRRGPAQGVDPPGQVIVRVLAEHGQDDVPTLAGELTHRARQVRRGIHFEPTVVGPLPQVLEQTAGAPALAGDHENPQERQCLLTRRCGRDRGLHVNSWNHPLVPAPPRYRATSTSASSVPLPWRARMCSASCCGLASCDKPSAKPSRIPSVAKMSVSPGAMGRTTGCSRGSSDPTMPPRVTILARVVPDRGAPSPYSSRPSTLPTPSHVIGRSGRSNPPT